jgi:hypothetical protein
VYSPPDRRAGFKIRYANQIILLNSLINMEKFLCTLAASQMLIID